MAKQIVFFFEVIILLTLFVFFGSLTATTFQNDRIIDITENFAETVRYKGCITKSMYDDLLKQYPTAVKVGFQIEKAPDLIAANDAKTYRLTNEVVSALYDGSGIYKMEVGDMFTISVRKASPTYFDAMVGNFNGEGATSSPLISIKGGMILNEQYV